MSEQAKELAARKADAAWDAVYEVLDRETAARLQRAVRATAEAWQRIHGCDGCCNPEGGNDG